MAKCLRLRWIRATAASLALTLEVLWLTATFQAPDASSVPQLQWLVALFNDAYHRRAAILVGAAFLLLASHDIRRTLGVLRAQGGYLWWPWVAAHGVALLSFALLTSIGFGTFTGIPALSVAWAVAWVAADQLADQVAVQHPHAVQFQHESVGEVLLQ